MPQTLRKRKSDKTDAGQDDDAGGTAVKVAKQQKGDASAANRNGCVTNGTDKQPAKKVAASKGKGTANSVAASNGAAAASSSRTIVFKGVAPVDSECKQLTGKAHVYFFGNDIYDVMLNQTSVQNNNNKYYIIQLLEDDKAKKHYVWQRWGRVGYGGQNTLVPCTDLENAKDVFCKKFFDKTKNEFGDRRKFRKYDGKYDYVEIDYNAKESDDSAKKKETQPVKKSPVPDCTLDQRVQELLKLICDVKAMEESLVEMKYDTQKAPLGKLTAAQIKAGYAALKTIDACVDEGHFGPRLVEACNEFYTRIPHCFGMQRPPLIRDKASIKAKIQLLEALGDIEITLRTLKAETDENLHPLDKHYTAMKADLKPLDPSAEEFKVLSDYLLNTHAATHNLYKMRVVNIFECCKETDEFKDVGNKHLLWHGSRLTNWYGILCQGLRIAPPEAPVTGYMFGKGIYFADVSSKSANYCFATKSKPLGLMLLSEVALGNCRGLLAADYNAHNIPKGFHSTKGLGKMAPDATKNRKIGDCVVPTGSCVDTGVTNPNGYTLNYNEYVVYDPKQVRLRYLVQLEFDFKP